MRRGPGGVGAINRQRLARVNTTLIINICINSLKCFEEHFVVEFKVVEAFSSIRSLRSMARSLQVSSL